jgi:hypothetical protein
MTDVGITSVRELRGLSATSAHRPGDAVSGPVQVPIAYDAGGELRWVVDTTVTYLSPSNFHSAVHGDADAEVAKAERDKEAAVRREIAAGQRSALPPGFRFVPAAMDTRGRKGPQLASLASGKRCWHRWLSTALRTRWRHPPRPRREGTLRKGSWQCAFAHGWRSPCTAP